MSVQRTAARERAYSRVEPVKCFIDIGLSHRRPVSGGARRPAVVPKINPQLLGGGGEPQHPVAAVLQGIAEIPRLLVNTKINPKARPQTDRAAGNIVPLKDRVDFRVQAIADREQVL